MRRHLCVAPTGRTIDQIERWRRTWVHPRTSARGPGCLALAGHRLDAEIRVREVWHTETSADTFTVLRRFPLATGSGR